MTTSAESVGLGARAELRAWYLGRLRPRLVEAVAAGIVGPGAVEELDLQIADIASGRSSTLRASRDIQVETRSALI